MKWMLKIFTRDLQGICERVIFLDKWFTLIFNALEFT